MLQFVFEGIFYSIGKTSKKLLIMMYNYNVCRFIFFRFLIFIIEEKLTAINLGE